MKYLKYLLFIALGLLCISFVGIKKHTEQDQSLVFLKPQPSLKFIFKSPLENTLREIDALPYSLQREEKLYQSYAVDNHTHLYDYAALLLLQMGLFTISLCLLRLLFPRRKRKASIQKILSVNILGSVLILVLYQFFWLQQISLFWSLCILSCFNIYLIYTQLLGKR